MTESIITISIVGLIVGFIFSMPIAGPISILITSNALKGRTRYCNLATIGASFADLVYVFAAVFGLTNFYSLYKPFIPYVLLAGMIFLLILGYKIARTNITFGQLENEKNANGKSKKNPGGFWTGFLLNFLNPTLFLGWLTSSFIIISLVASLGFNTGGLDRSVDTSFKTLNTAAEDSALKSKTLSYLHIDSTKIKKQEQQIENAKAEQPSPLLLSICYAVSLSLGSIIWFLFLTYILAKYRHKVNIKIINRIIQMLGYALFIFALFLGYKAINMLIS